MGGDAPADPGVLHPLFLILNAPVKSPNKPLGFFFVQNACLLGQILALQMSFPSSTHPGSAVLDLLARDLRLWGHT